MKKEYEAANIEIILWLGKENVITASPEFTGSTEGEGGTIAWPPSSDRFE